MSSRSHVFLLCIHSSTSILSFLCLLLILLLLLLFSFSSPSPSSSTSVERICTERIHDRPFCRDACFRQANVQSEAVVSYAMTIMDESCGWEDEEKRAGSNFAACMWICNKEVMTDKRTNTHSGNGGVLEATFVVHYAMFELGLCWYFH